jgi:hypothetical protein
MSEVIRQDDSTYTVMIDGELAAVISREEDIEGSTFMQFHPVGAVDLVKVRDIWLEYLDRQIKVAAEWGPTALADAVIALRHPQDRSIH